MDLQASSFSKSSFSPQTLNLLSKQHKTFLILHFLAFLCFSFPYYSLDVCIYGIHDNINRLSDEMKDKDIEDQIIIAEYISNIATPIIAGFITDYAGVRYVLYSVNFLSVISQLIIFCWVQIKYVSFEYLLMGRILYVVSFESYFVASITLLSRWCIKNSFSMAINLTLVMGEGCVYIVIYIISFYYSRDLVNESRSFDYLYVIVLIGSITILVSVVLTHFIIKLYKNIEYDQEINPRNLRSLWKSLQYSLNFKFICLFINFGLISSSFNWFVQYFDQYINNYVNDSNSLPISQIYEAIPYLILVIISIIMAFSLGKNKPVANRITLMIFGSVLLLISNIYLYFSLNFKEAYSIINKVLIVFAIIILGIGYSLHYTVIYTCVPLLECNKQGFLQKNKEIGIKFGILRWFRSIFNFFMFLMISDFKNAFDNYWISSLFVLFELMLYGLLIKVYDRKIFDKEEIEKTAEEFNQENNLSMRLVSDRKINCNAFEEDEKISEDDNEEEEKEYTHKEERKIETT